MRVIYLEQHLAQRSPQQAFAVVILLLEPLLTTTPGCPHAAAQAPEGGSKGPLALGAMLPFL